MCISAFTVICINADCATWKHSCSDLWVCLYCSYHKSSSLGHFCSGIYWPKTICVKNVLRSCQICTRGYLRKHSVLKWMNLGKCMISLPRQTFCHNILVPYFIKRNLCFHMHLLTIESIHLGQIKRSAGRIQFRLAASGWWLWLSEQIFRVRSSFTESSSSLSTALYRNKMPKRALCYVFLGILLWGENSSLLIIIIKSENT